MSPFGSFFTDFRFWWWVIAFLSFIFPNCAHTSFACNIGLMGVPDHSAFIWTHRLISTLLRSCRIKKKIDHLSRALSLTMISSRLFSLIRAKQFSHVACVRKWLVVTRCSTRLIVNQKKVDFVYVAFLFPFLKKEWRVRNRIDDGAIRYRRTSLSIFRMISQRHYYWHWDSNVHFREAAVASPHTLCWPLF